MILAVVVVILGLGALAGALVLTAGDGDEGRETAAVTYSMAGTSMEPTWSHGDRVTAREIDGDEVDRGDVVVNIPAADAGRPHAVLKRVVAVAGDQVASVDDRLWVNGEPADEPYLAPGTATTDVAPQDSVRHVFVMGDDRPNSQDSRTFGPVPTGDIVALVDPP